MHIVQEILYFIFYILFIYLFYLLIHLFSIAGSMPMTRWTYDMKHET